MLALELRGPTFLRGTLYWRIVRSLSAKVLFTASHDVCSDSQGRLNGSTPNAVHVRNMVQRAFEAECYIFKVDPVVLYRIVFCIIP